jgi:hypothetical protein
VWAALPNNDVLAAKFTHLTTREDNRLARQQARTACAAALLRWIHVVITASPALHRGVAIGPRWRRHQDTQIPADSRPARPVH